MVNVSLDGFRPFWTFSTSTIVKLGLEWSYLRYVEVKDAPKWLEIVPNMVLYDSTENELIMSHLTIKNCQKQPRLVPNMLWNDPKPPKIVHKLSRNGPKMIQISPNWSQIVQSSPNSTTNLLKEKNVGVTHEKWAFDPKNPVLVRF